MFFQHFREILDEHPEVMILYKPKNDPPVLPIHPRWFTLPKELDPAFVIACAHVTFGLPFTSPVVEAWGAGKQAYWYDPFTQRDTTDFYGINQDGLAADRFRELLTK